VIKDMTCTKQKPDHASPTCGSFLDKDGVFQLGACLHNRPLMDGFFERYYAYQAVCGPGALLLFPNFERRHIEFTLIFKSLAKLKLDLDFGRSRSQTIRWINALQPHEIVLMTSMTSNLQATYQQETRIYQTWLTKFQFDGVTLESA